MDGIVSITDVGMPLPTVHEILGVLTLSAGFNAAVVVVGTTLLGIAAGMVGAFIVLRKRAMMADALSHAALPGLCVAFLLLGSLGYSKNLPALLAGAALSGIAGVGAVQLIVAHTRLHQDAAIGIVLSVFFGLGVTLMSVIQTLGWGGEGGLHHFIYGQTAAMSREDALLIAAVALVAVIASVAFVKEFTLVCFDEQFAATQGWSVGRIDLLMMGLTVVVTVVGLQAVGLILVIAFLIVPPAAARFWTERLSVMIGLSAAFGGFSGYFGSSLSALFPRLPAGSVIVLTAGVLFIFSMYFAPRRGVFAAMLRAMKLKARIAREHILRGLYEVDEAKFGSASANKFVPMRDVLFLRAWSRRTLFPLLITLRLRGLVTFKGRQVALTERGFLGARSLTRNHRLWEEYLMRYADISPSHVDYTADIIEHIGQDEILRELEAALAARGMLPGESKLSDSPHPLSVAKGAQ